MSGKREASYTIDPNTFEEKEKDAEDNNELQSNTNKIPKQQRKIFKIKRPGQQDDSEKRETKVAFKLNQPQQIKSDAEMVKGSTENSNEAEQIYKEAAMKKDENQSKQSANPFSSLFKNDANAFQGIGIFSNLKSTNLFTSNQGTQSSAKATTSLFGGPSIFANKGSNIFDNSNSLKNTSASLFPKKETANDEEGSGDSAQLQQAQNVQVHPEESKVNYAYDESCPVLFSCRVAKFKKSGGQLIQNVEITLQKQKQTNIKYIIVRLPATKKSIFSGVLVEGRSDIKHIHGKKQNVEVGAFYKEKAAFTKSYLKFQFQNPEDGEKLYERLEDLLSSSSKQQASTSDTTKQPKSEKKE